MNIRKQEAYSDDARRALQVLRETVVQTLDKKRRLGHYAVIWDNGKAVVTGDDAPQAPHAPDAANQSDAGAAGAARPTGR